MFRPISGEVNIKINNNIFYWVIPTLNISVRLFCVSLNLGHTTDNILLGLAFCYYAVSTFSFCLVIQGVLTDPQHIDIYLVDSDINIIPSPTYYDIFYGFHGD